jgi:hypothetical protein
VKLQDHPAIDRLPDTRSYDILGMALPLIEIDAGMASSPARIRAALNWLKLPLAARETVALRHG